MAITKKAAPAKRALPKSKMTKKTSNKAKRVSPWTHEVSGTDISFYKNGELVNMFELDSVDKLTCSCGVYEIDGVSDIEDLIHDDSIPQRVIKAGLIELIGSIKAGDAAFVIASNNENTPITNRILNSICIRKTPFVNNPNSGNNICVWVL